MSFLAGARLLLLLGVAALLAAYVATQLRRRTYAVRFTNLALLDSVAPARAAWRRHLPAAAFLCMLAALVVAFARPTRTIRIPRERATIVVAVDTSVSMSATDVEPNRLEAAKGAALAFVDQLPRRFNVGLVSFSGTAQVLVPPTTDREVTRQAINSLELGPRTAIGEAIFASLETVKSVPSDGAATPAPARVVLMSDGETTAGRPNDEAAAAAVEAGVPVSTIAYGTDEGFIEVQGRLVQVPVNKDALREVAHETKGSFFEASSGEELRSVYRDIGSSVGYIRRHREVTAWWVGASLVFAALAAAGSLLWSSRLP